MGKIKKKKLIMVRCFCVTCGNLLVLGNSFLYGKRGKNSKKYPNCVKRNDDTKSFLCLFFFSLLAREVVGKYILNGELFQIPG